MPPNTGNHQSSDGERGGFDRRTVLKAVGATAGASYLVSGTAAAHQTQFYGCSQVCSDSRGNEAVVATGDSYELRDMDRVSHRRDVSWSWDSHCYEADGDEAIVGVVIDDPDGDCTFCRSPNNCASNHFGDVDEILDAIDGTDPSCERITAGSCNVSGTGGREGREGRGRGRRDGKTPGRGGRGKRAPERRQPR